jgi:uncharacterized protein (TIGR00730 family)
MPGARAPTPHFHAQRDYVSLLIRMAADSAIRAVTVYCSSSSSIADSFTRAGEALGRAIASRGWALVYGGNSIGLMKTLADAARAAHGRVIGVTPQALVDKGIHDTKCDELIVTAGMRERKAIMEERGDAFVALPGGLGTLEEIFEIIVGRSLGYHHKPIVLLNVSGFYDPLLAMIEHGIEQRFIKPRAREAYFVASDVPQAVSYLQSAANAHPPVPAEPSAAE